MVLRVGALDTEQACGCGHGPSTSFIKVPAAEDQVLLG